MQECNYSVSKQINSYQNRSFYINTDQFISKKINKIIFIKTNFHCFQIDSFVLDEQEEETGELSEDEDEEDDSRLGEDDLEDGKNQIRSIFNNEINQSWSNKINFYQLSSNQFDYGRISLTKIALFNLRSNQIRPDLQSNMYIT